MNCMNHGPERHLEPSLSSARRGSLRLAILSAVLFVLTVTPASAIPFLDANGVVQGRELAGNRPIADHRTVVSTPRPVVVGPRPVVGAPRDVLPPSGLLSGPGGRGGATHETPDPATLLMLGASAVGVAWWRKRRGR